MKSKIISLFLIFSLALLASCNEKEANSLGAVKEFTVQDALEEVDGLSATVILLYGQSNATGVAYNAYLQIKSPEDYSKCSAGYSNVLINFITENGWNSSSGKFVPCSLGQAVNEHCFGPEIGIADVLSKAFQDEKVFIIKYSWGGTILFNQWLDGKGNRGELYDASNKFTVASLEYLKSKGYKPTIKAVCWMQGESDSIDDNMSEKYFDNTKKFVGYLRKDLKNYCDGDFKFIDAGIAEIAVWKNHAIVNDAKKAYAESNADCEYFSTSEMGLSTLEEPEGNADVAHYDALSMLALGRKFGELALD